MSSTGGEFGSCATGLRCKECGHQTGLIAAYVCEYCFGPLEVEYDKSRLASTITRQRIAEGPLNLWRYRDLLPCAPTDPTRGLSAVAIPRATAPTRA